MTDPARETSEALIEAIKSMFEQAHARGLAEGRLAGMTNRHRSLLETLRQIAGPPYSKSFKTAPKAKKLAVAALVAEGEAP